MQFEKLFNLQLLRGDPDTLTGLIDEDAFESNSKRLEKEYEEYVLTEGDFDERMYLSAERQADFGMDTQQEDFLKTFDKQALFKTCPPLNELRHHIMPATPLTGKKYLGEKDDPLISPVSSATQTVSRLQVTLICTSICWISIITITSPVNFNQCVIKV